MNDIKLLIFDLGNVVYKCTFENAISYWAEKTESTFSDLRNRFKIDEYYSLHEINKISIDEYKVHVCTMLQIELSLDDFIVGWNSIFMNEIKGIRTILEYLKNKYSVIAFSNTNTTHCQIMKEKYERIFTSFDKLYFSNEIGLRKPDSDAFKFIIAKHGMKPENVIFFDDLIENIEGAKKIGINVVHVNGIQSIKNGIRKLGI